MLLTVSDYTMRETILELMQDASVSEISMCQKAEYRPIIPRPT